MAGRDDEPRRKRAPGGKEHEECRGCAGGGNGVGDRVGVAGAVSANGAVGSGAAMTAREAGGG